MCCNLSVNDKINSFMSFNKTFFQIPLISTVFRSAEVDNFSAQKFGISYQRNKMPWESNIFQDSKKETETSIIAM